VLKLKILSNYSFEKVLFSIIPSSQRKYIDKGVSNIKCTELENPNNNEFPPLLHSYDLKMLKIFETRRFTQISNIYMNENTFIMISKPCNNLNINEKIMRII
jgi:hypothetical protein